MEARLILRCPVLDDRFCLTNAIRLSPPPPPALSPLRQRQRTPRSARKTQRRIANSSRRLIAIQASEHPRKFLEHRRIEIRPNHLTRVFQVFVAQHRLRCTSKRQCRPLQLHHVPQRLRFAVPHQEGVAVQRGQDLLANLLSRHWLAGPADNDHPPAFNHRLGHGAQPPRLDQFTVGPTAGNVVDDDQADADDGRLATSTPSEIVGAGESDFASLEFTELCRLSKSVPFFEISVRKSMILQWLCSY